MANRKDKEGSARTADVVDELCETYRQAIDYVRRSQQENKTLEDAIVAKDRQIARLEDRLARGSLELANCKILLDRETPPPPPTPKTKGDRDPPKTRQRLPQFVWFARHTSISPTADIAEESTGSHGISVLTGDHTAGSEHVIKVFPHDGGAAGGPSLPRVRRPARKLSGLFAWRHRRATRSARRDLRASDAALRD